MVENNPNLLQLRVLETVAGFAAGEGNTIMFGVPTGLTPTDITPIKKTAR